MRRILRHLLTHCDQRADTRELKNWRISAKSQANRQTSYCSHMLIGTYNNELMSFSALSYVPNLVHLF